MAVSYQTSVAIGFRAELWTSRIGETETEVITSTDSQGTIKFNFICLVANNKKKGITHGRT